MKRSRWLLAACTAMFAAAGSVVAAPRDVSEPTSTVIANQNGDGRIEVLTQGDGPVIVLLPSFGRGASDFDAIAIQLASAGYRVLRPQPRGIGRSVAPMVGINLHDYAADVATVIEQDRMGPAFVVGHGFGSQIARTLAADRPELVSAVAIVAADAGTSSANAVIREAIRNSADPALPPEERIKALQRAFFAPGNDARSWLWGWYPEVLAAERRAAALTPRDNDFVAGELPILYVRPAHDPLSKAARAKDARAYRERFRSRASVVVIGQASHAVIVEQPDAVSAALIDYARKLWPHAMLQ